MTYYTSGNFPGGDGLPEWYQDELNDEDDLCCDCGEHCDDCACLDDFDEYECGEY